MDNVQTKYCNNFWYLHYENHMRFEVVIVVKMSLVVFSVVMLCRLVGGCQRFRGTYCLHLQPVKFSPHLHTLFNIRFNIFLGFPRGLFSSRFSDLDKSNIFSFFNFNSNS
jgi:hypothetical protein